MILVLVETDADGVVEVSLEAITFARALGDAGGGVPVDAVVVGEVTDDRCASSSRRTASAPCTAPAATAFAAYAGAGLGGGRAGGPAAGGLGRGHGRRHRRAATRCWPTSPPARVWRWPPTCSSFGGLAPFVVTRQVVGGAALEEMELDQRPAVFTVAGHAVEPQPAAEPRRRRRGRRSRPRSPRRTWWPGWSRPRSRSPTCPAP